MYLLDTNIVIHALKQSPAVVAQLRHHEGMPLALCAVVLMELYYGAYKSQRVDSNLAKLRALEEAFPVIALDKACVDTFGRLKAGTERSGQPLDGFDLAIAATALVHNLVLVTNNTRHFGRIEGLRLEDWTA